MPTIHTLVFTFVIAASVTAATLPSPSVLSICRVARCLAVSGAPSQSKANRRRSTIKLETK